MAQFDPNNDAAQLNQASLNTKPSSVGGSQLGLSKRRNFLQRALGGAVAGLATTAGMEFLAPSSALAQTTAHPRNGAAGIARGQ